MNKYLNRRWVQVALAIIATVALSWYLLHKTAAGKKVAAKAANGSAAAAPATNTATPAPAPAAPATQLAGSVRYN